MTKKELTEAVHLIARWRLLGKITLNRPVENKSKNVLNNKVVRIKT